MCGGSLTTGFPKKSRFWRRPESERIADLSLDVVGLERCGIDGNRIDGQPRSGVFQGVDAAVGAGHQHVERRQDVAAAVEARQDDATAQAEGAFFVRERVERHFAERLHAGDGFCARLADADRFARGELEIEGPLDLVADQDGIAADAAPQRPVILCPAQRGGEGKQQHGQKVLLHIRLCF